MSKRSQTEVVYSFHDLNVDKEDGVISKVLLARVGKVKGHGEYADETFTSTIVEQGNEFPQGMKARFGHPNMSSTTLGTFIGRWRNFQIDGGNAYADLHLDEITKKAQLEGKGISMWDYILDMASNNPDMFGNSIVFRPKRSEVKREEIEPEEVDLAYDEIIEQKEDTVIVDRRYARIKNLLASDLVDSPAATESLFASFSTEKDFAFHATTFLDENPEIFKLLNENPEVLDGFMEKYNDYKTKKTNMSETKEEFSSEEVSFFKGLFSKSKVEKKPITEDTVSVELSEANDKVKELTKELGEAKESNVELNTAIDENKVALGELQTEFETQKAELAKFTTAESGAISTVDPTIDGAALSEREIKMNEAAAEMRDK